MIDPAIVALLGLDLVSLIGRDSQLKKVSSRKGGEYAGPCPFCGGTDRLHVWPQDEPPAWRCLGARAGRAGCGRGGDGIAYLVERGDLTPAQAGELRRGGQSWAAGMPARETPAALAPRYCEGLQAPGRWWQQAAGIFVAYAQARLWGSEGVRALDWLQGRGLTEETIRAAGLGYNPRDLRRTRQSWGLENGKPLWLPRGVVIPWRIAGELWRVNVRRPGGKPKYYSPAGFSNGLYNADALEASRPVILTEGEFDALSLAQHAGDLVAPVASGSTGGARRPRWIGRLVSSPLVLVAYDAEPEGDKAAVFWLDVLPNARRWRPWWGDANAMAQDGADLRAWVLAGLQAG